VPGRYALLIQTANRFSLAVMRGSDAEINRFATPDLLRRAPAGHLVNLFGIGNVPHDVFIRAIQLNGASASATLVFSFGSAVQANRASTWQYTADGWKLAGIGQYGKG
jgi:hypothetical protein